MQQNYVKIPKDLSLIKQKFIFGLTKRQAVCFGAALIIGFPVFFGVKALTNSTTVAALAMGIFAAPAIVCGLYEKNGIHFEQQAKLMYNFLKKPKNRTYQTVNKFLAIERQIEYNRLERLLNNAGYTSGFEKDKKKVTVFGKQK